MTSARKEELLNQILDLMTAVAYDREPDGFKTNTITKSADNPVEMLTVKECTEAVKGLSEHTVRKLIKQGKLPYLRTGDGVNGKMLINKADLLAYFNGQTANR